MKILTKLNHWGVGSANKIKAPLSFWGISSQDNGSYEHLGDQLTINGSYELLGGQLPI